VQAWLAQQDARELTISDCLVTEFSSALSIKLRTGQLATEHRAAALATLTRLAAETFGVLAVRADHGERLCTLDRRLGEARPLVGIETLHL
jgi:hypothetical protein